MNFVKGFSKKAFKKQNTQIKAKCKFTIYLKLNKIKKCLK